MWQLTMWESAGEPAPRPARLSAAAEQAQLARLRKRVDDRWRALALAQERATSIEALERLYDAYMRAVDAYVTSQRALSHPGLEQRRAS
ncbi:MAG: hypothetical protein KGO05_10985 [Chloroflexota bacterium]|nr:hypothetical protein [Chloroflexota bacterium]